MVSHAGRAVRSEGGPAVVICPVCGARSSDTASFCSQCFTRFSLPEPVATSGRSEPVRATSEAEWAGKKCAYCMTELQAGDDVLLCGACGMPLHQSCWEENGGCATFGCMPADGGTAAPSAAVASTLVATFGPTTGWSGKVITWEGGVFTLQDYGPITAADVQTYDRQGQLVWANDGMRAWVESNAGAPQAASGGPSVIAAFAATTGWSGKVITWEGGVFTLQDYGPITAADVQTYDRQGQLVWANDGMRAWVESNAGAPQAEAFKDGRSAAGMTTDDALGSSNESTAPRQPIPAEDKAPPAIAVGAPIRSISDEVLRLSELHARGILTDDEFAAAKGKLLK